GRLAAAGDARTPVPEPALLPADLRGRPQPSVAPAGAAVRRAAGPAALPPRCGLEPALRRRAGRHRRLLPRRTPAMTATLWPWTAVAVGALVTYLPRALGVLLAGRIDAEGRLFDWVACVAYAILAALVARMIVLPTGPLVETSLATRLAGAAAAVAIF